ncbi:TonB-dependent receptor (plasmid) [Methylosinus sp. 3S-1]
MPLPDPATSATLIRFAIAPQPLSSAIVAFSRATGCDLIFDGAIASGMRTQGVDGSFTAQNGLARLLAGTGLAARLSNERMMRMFRASAAEIEKTEEGATPLDPIDIAAPKPAPNRNAMIGAVPAPYAGGLVATGGQLGMLGNRDVMDTPFNQTSYTAQTIMDQQARTIADVTANDASVRPNWPSATFNTGFNIRGFSINPWDISMNGLYGVVPTQNPAVEFAERIEILKGPSALLNGVPPFGSVGGAVNVVPKRAGDEPLTRLTASYYSNLQPGVTVDIGRRFGEDKQFGVRFNGVYRKGDTAVDRQKQELVGTFLGLDYRGDRMRLSADLGYQRQHMDSPIRIVGLSSGLPVPAAPKSTSNWSQPWSYADVTEFFGMMRGEYDLSPDWTASFAVGGRGYDAKYLWSNPLIANNNGNFVDNVWTYPSYADASSQELRLHGRFATGFIDHEVTATGTRFYSELGGALSTVASISSNLYYPTFVSRPAIPDISVPRNSDGVLSSLAFADVMSVLDERVQIIAGLREQQIEARNYNTATGAITSRYQKSALSPAVGLVLKPEQNISFYGNYIQGLQQGAVVASNYVNAGEILPPYISTQYELGVKVDWGRIISTVSWFEITQPSGLANSATNTYSADGAQRNRGVELNSYGQLTDAVRFIGGLTLLDGVLTKTAKGAYDGNVATGAPHVQLNLGGEWDTPFVGGLTLSGRVIYTGSQYVDIANTQQIPDWARFDFGMRYKFESYGVPIVIRLNVENAFDRSYWQAAAPAGGAYLSSGAPRRFLLSTSVDF